ncbi:hypothetical protein CXG81DRAFT_18814 [Caulochytrium protostelioides]|uniref:Uncharacterized protein n=1 Tax=Caulochytrium protostelioides TaxID=1555241 RepID=A0A4P9X801_9FUNG|nr:hypothetical protein CXG81DRAFT_18814 [Caulochytrium protostelioides]|eukprot:RKP01394.1 hypothetical protein CXG81DRAFT_18814 [Caulochytrium protostelioides]
MADPSRSPASAAPHGHRGGPPFDGPNAGASLDNAVKAFGRMTIASAAPTTATAPLPLPLPAAPTPEALADARAGVLLRYSIDQLKSLRSSPLVSFPRELQNNPFWDEVVESARQNREHLLALRAEQQQAARAAGAPHGGYVRGAATRLAPLCRHGNEHVTHHNSYWVYLVSSRRFCRNRRLAARGRGARGGLPPRPGYNGHGHGHGSGSTTPRGGPSARGSDAGTPTERAPYAHPPGRAGVWGASQNGETTPFHARFRAGGHDRPHSSTSSSLSYRSPSSDAPARGDRGNMDDGMGSATPSASSLPAQHIDTNACPPGVTDAAWKGLDDMQRFRAWMRVKEGKPALVAAGPADAGAAGGGGLSGGASGAELRRLPSALSGTGLDLSDLVADNGGLLPGDGFGVGVGPGAGAGEAGRGSAAKSRLARFFANDATGTTSTPPSAAPSALPAPLDAKPSALSSAIMAQQGGGPPRLVAVSLGSAGHGSRGDGSPDALSAASATSPTSGRPNTGMSNILAMLQRSKENIQAGLDRKPANESLSSTDDAAKPAATTMMTATTPGLAIPTATSHLHPGSMRRESVDSPGLGDSTTPTSSGRPSISSYQAAHYASPQTTLASMLQNSISAKKTSHSHHPGGGASQPPSGAASRVVSGTGPGAAAADARSRALPPSSSSSLSQAMHVPSVYMAQSQTSAASVSAAASMPPPPLGASAPLGPDAAKPALVSPMGPYPGYPRAGMHPMDDGSDRVSGPKPPRMGPSGAMMHAYAASHADRGIGGSMHPGDGLSDQGLRDHGPRPMDVRLMSANGDPQGHNHAHGRANGYPPVSQGASQPPASDTYPPDPRLYGVGGGGGGGGGPTGPEGPPMFMPVYPMHPGHGELPPHGYYPPAMVGPGGPYGRMPPPRGPPPPNAPGVSVTSVPGMYPPPGAHGDYMMPEPMHRYPGGPGGMGPMPPMMRYGPGGPGGPGVGVGPMMGPPPMFHPLHPSGPPPPMHLGGGHVAQPGSGPGPGQGSHPHPGMNYPSQGPFA